MARIGIDARMYGISFGIGRYLRNLITEIQKLDSQNEYFLFLLKKDLPKLKLVKNFHKVEADFTWYGITEQTKMPKLLKRYNLDLVHFPHFNIPVFYRGRFVVTIHDLIHLDFKMVRASTRGRMVYDVKHQVHKWVISQALKRSEKVITPSEFVKNEILKKWTIKGSKVVVTPESVEESFIRLFGSILPGKIKKVLDKFNIRPPYVFYIGAAHPHKNVEGLIRAFLDLRKKYQYLTLVLSGEDNYFWQRIKKEYSSKDIIFTGYVSDEESAALLKSASCYVQPSLSEGFGLPLLEAFAAGVPVVSSDFGSLPEVGGDAALYFNPRDTKDMVDKISTVLNNSKLSHELVNEGKGRLKEFSWKKMAQQTYRVYSESLG